MSWWDDVDAWTSEDIYDRGVSETVLDMESWDDLNWNEDEEMDDFLDDLLG